MCLLGKQMPDTKSPSNASASSQRCHPLFSFGFSSQCPPGRCTRWDIPPQSMTFWGDQECPSTSEILSHSKVLTEPPCQSAQMSYHGSPWRKAART